MKHQALFLRKIKVKKMKCRLLQFLSGALRVNMYVLLLLSVVAEKTKIWTHKIVT